MIWVLWNFRGHPVILLSTQISTLNDIGHMRFSIFPCAHVSSGSSSSTCVRRSSHRICEPAPQRYHYPVSLLRAPIILCPGCMILVGGPGIGGTLGDIFPFHICARSNEHRVNMESENPKRGAVVIDILGREEYHLSDTSRNHHRSLIISRRKNVKM